MSVRAVAFQMLLAGGLACMTLAGCASISPAGPLRTQSTGSESNMLLLGKSEAIYGSAKQVESSFIVSTVPVQQLIDGTINTGQVVHFELLWIPKGGWTPLSPSATNISIRHVVFVKGEIGVYEGAGFAMPDGDVGSKSLSVTILSGTLRLAQSTRGFVDKLGEAEMAGSFKASLAPGKTAAAEFALSQLVTNALGKSTYVQRSDDATKAYISLVLADFQADLNDTLNWIDRSRTP